MRVLFLANIPSPYRVDFFSELGKFCDLTVLYERNDALDRNADWMSNKSRNFKSKVLKGIKIGNDSALCFPILKELTQNKFDFIIIGGYSSPTSILAIEYLKLLKIPFILNIDGGQIKKEHSIMYFIKKRFISSASAWLSSGSYSDKYLNHYGADEEMIFHYPFTSLRKNELPNSRSTLNEKQKLKEALGIKEDKIVLSIGRIVHGKGFDNLLKASTLIDETVGVYIIGGKPTAELTKLVEENKLSNVNFVDFKQKNELSNYYKIADLFVLPTRGDIWGLVINEAMSYGLPVITTEKCVAGLELIVNGENGYLVPVENYLVLSQRINEVICNDKLMKKSGENNIMKISKYTIEDMALRHVQIFEELNRCKKFKK